ncbi:MAG: acyltransferase family protein [Bryobacteraceae bacterium]
MSETAASRAPVASVNWLPELDGLRSVAALAVVIVHYTPVTAPTHAIPVVLSSVGSKLSIANLSVAFFYGLSAFLLTYIELRRRDAGRPMSLAHFFLRRACRIWPLYFFIVAFGFLIMAPGVFFAHARPDIRHGWIWAVEHSWLYLTFTSNWSLALQGFGGYLDQGTASHQISWSIAVEEQFYLLFPFALWLCFRRRRAWIKVAVGALLLGTLFRAALVWAGASSSTGNPAGYIYYATLSYLEVFCAGALAAVLFRSVARWPKVSAILAQRTAGAALIAAILTSGWLWSFYCFPPYTAAEGAASQALDFAVAVVMYPIVALVIGTSLLWITLNERSFVSRILRTPFLRSLGTLSFGIYMWHPLVNPLIQAMDRYHVVTMPMAGQLLGANLLFLLYISLTVACAGITYFLVEAPVLRWKERFTRREANSSARDNREDRRSPALIFPGAIAMAVLLAIVVSAEALHPPETRAGDSRASSPTVAPVPATSPTNITPPPGIPGGLTVERSSSTAVLSWRPPRGVERYDIEIGELREAGAVVSRVVSAPRTNTTYGFSDLSTDSKYRFRIRACNTPLCSEWSAAIVGAPPAHPETP